MADIRTVIAAFSEEHAERLTGISAAQLRYWDRTRFYRPAYRSGGHSAFSRIYSFRDIVALRVLHVLRNKHGVPLKHLREVGEKLHRYSDDYWTKVNLWVLNKRVVWEEPETKRPEDVMSKQTVVAVVMNAIIAETEDDIAKISVRDASKQGHVEKSRYVQHNAAVIAGTRIPVAAIQRFFRAGYTAAQILKEYPDLTERDVKAALAYESSRAA
jgi:uncharacterized protein (DUF433 family)